MFVDYSVLTQDEIDILNRVVKKFKDYTGAECADYMHKEKAYRDTKEEEIISFELTKELNNFDEILTFSWNPIPCYNVSSSKIKGKVFIVSVDNFLQKFFLCGI